MNNTINSNKTYWRVSTTVFLTIPFLLSSILSPNSPVFAQESSKPYSFIIIGDGGKPGKVVKANAKAAQSTTNHRVQNPLAMVFLGDNFYPIGLNLPEDERKVMIEEIIGPYRTFMVELGKENVHAIAGNHDYYCGELGPIPFGECNSGNRYERNIPEWTYYYGHPSSSRYPLSEGSNDSLDMFFFDSALLLTTTDKEKWGPYLDSLSRLLDESVRNPNVRWRTMMVHHSPYSVGSHGGFRVWDADKMHTGYRGCCKDEGDDPFRFAQQLVSHEDNCDPLYKAYVDSIYTRFETAKAKIHILFAGHDHSLQLMNLPGTPGIYSPEIFVISGAGSKQTSVRISTPPYIFTHPLNTPEGQGVSEYGFVAFSASSKQLSLSFIKGEDGTTLPMGGIKDFIIDQRGSLVEMR